MIRYWGYTFAFVSLMVIAETNGSNCRDGFELIPGDIPGWGQFGNAGKFSNIEDTDKCGQLCLANSHCKSYEYSETEKKCNLNRASKPNRGVYKDYSFCAVKVKGK